MLTAGKKRSAGSPLRRRSRAWLARAAILVAVGGFCAGCDNEEDLITFRDAAATSLQQGISTLFDGLLEGVFAVLGSGDGSGGG